jgi:mxaK protein
MPGAVKHRLALALALLAGSGAAWELWQWRAADQIAQALAEFATGHDIGPERRFGAALPVRLGYALYLGRQERLADAQAELAELSSEGSPAFRARVLYDLGNVYFRQALETVERGEAGRAAPLAELAKDTYRRALRTDPGFRDAKYNLEAASRLMPDFDLVDNGTEVPDEAAARKLWTRVPGFPRGLP